MQTRSETPGGKAPFTYSSFVLGGGIKVPRTRHVSVRPDVEAMLVRRDARSYVVSTFAVHVEHRFEHHPVTPARRSR